jgi:RNA polymerase sigma-70 factor (ECF subfamily)
MADTKPLTMPGRIGRRGDVLARAEPSRTELRTPAHAEDRDQWIVAAKAGDEAAFTKLYRDVQPRLLRYAAGLAGPDAEEITAEAWLQIVRDLADFTGDLDAFRGWAARIVRNRAIDSARARTRRPVELQNLDATLDRPTAQDTAHLVLDNLATAWALELIARLPADQAEAVLLRAVVGLDAKTAGTVLGKRAGAVRVAAHRGLKTLARMLAETGPPAPHNRPGSSRLIGEV